VKCTLRLVENRWTVLASCPPASVIPAKPFAWLVKLRFDARCATRRHIGQRPAPQPGQAIRRVNRLQCFPTTLFKRSTNDAGFRNSVAGFHVASSGTEMP